MSYDELQISLEAHEQRMKERNYTKAKAGITLQARFNEKDKKSKEKNPMKSRGSFPNFGGRESQSSKNLACQKGERSCNKIGGQGNFKGERRRIDKSKIQCFGCKKFCHFARESNANNKEPQLDEEKVSS